MIKFTAKKRWLIFILEIAFFVMLYFAVRSYQQKDMIQGLAPALSGVTLKGDSFELHSLRGRPVLVYFWASWCGICRFGEAAIQDISRDYATITVAMQSGSDAELVQHLKRNSRDFPVLNDNAGEIARRFGVYGVPASFIIDRQGNIAFTERGYTTELGLRARLWWVK